MIISSLISVLEVVLVTVPMLLVVAYVTVAERKTMASMQRRVGPNKVGYLGLLQALKHHQTKRAYLSSHKLYNSSYKTNEHNALYYEEAKELYKE